MSVSDALTLTRLDAIADAARRRLEAFDYGHPAIRHALARRVVREWLDSHSEQIVEDAVRSLSSGEAPSWDHAFVSSSWPGWVASQPPDLAKLLCRSSPALESTPGRMILVFDRAYRPFAEKASGPALRPRIEAALSEWLGRPTTFRAACLS